MQRQPHESLEVFAAQAPTPCSRTVTVFSWGDNDEGQLGNGASGASRPLGTYPKPPHTPVRVTGLADIVDIGAGTRFAVALRRDGTVWAWGARDEGAIGGGDTMHGGSLRVVSAMAAVRVAGLENINQIATRLDLP